LPLYAKPFHSCPTYAPFIFCPLMPNFSPFLMLCSTFQNLFALMPNLFCFLPPYAHCFPL
jgi:hypothetical protein